MRKLVSCMAVIACLVLVVPFAVGCSEPEEENTSAFGEENTFIKLLRLLPAEAKEGRVITIIDYEKWRQVNEVSVYNEDGQRIDREEYIDRLRDVVSDDSFFGDDVFLYSSYWTHGGTHICTSSIQDENTGYEVTDVDAEISNMFYVFSPDAERLFGSDVFGYSQEAMIAAVGDYDSQATNAALGNHNTWPLSAIVNYTSEEYRDIIIHNWGDSLELHLDGRLSPPHMNDLGQAVPLAVSDGFLFIGSSVEYIKSMIDVSLKESSSLAYVPEYHLVARGMYELGAIMALIMDEAHTRDSIRSFSSLMRPRIIEFRTVGIGPGRDEVGTYMALVLVYSNNADAEEDVALVEKKIDKFNTYCDRSPYSANVSIYDTEIRTEGRLLLAKLYSVDESLWRYWFFNMWEMAYYEEMMDEFIESFGGISK